MTEVKMIDSPNKKDAPRGWLKNNRVARSKAHPKQTLFGTTLQIRNKDEEMKYKKTHDDEMIYLKNEKPNSAMDRDVHSDEQMHSKKKSESTQPQLPVSLPKNTLSPLDEKSRYFRNSSAAKISKLPEERPTVRLRPPEKSTDYMADMNDAGLKEDYIDHHKSGSRPPIHQYSFCGNHMDMDISEITAKPNHMIPKMRPFKRYKDPFAIPMEAYMKDIVDEKILEGAGVAIPANIKHKFGTEICEMLLSDPEKVKNTIATQQRFHMQLHKSHKPVEKIATPEHGLEPSYNDLGNAIRANVFGPSITVNHKVGTMKRSFNEDVFKQRVAETDTYRFQRDSLSTWAEQEVLRDRVQRAWAMKAMPQRGDV